MNRRADVVIIDDMDTAPLRHALRADLDTVVDIWVDAFDDDPYFRWIAADDATYREFVPEWLSFIAHLVFERGHTYLDRDERVAIAWIPPDLALVGPPEVERATGIIATHAGEARAADALSTIMTARGHALAVPHWTLQYLGVRSTSRGHGVGAAAVVPGLERCDADGLPCGLVSTNPRNVSFYERLGFRTVAEVPTPDAAALLRPMHRIP